jgi:NADH-quinone oxidoreductase subunit G
MVPLMPTLEIDGQSVTVEAGLNLIQAADRINLEIPHYCFHPGLSIAGNCRICLVEIERMPKLQIACNTRVADGMVVRTRSQRVEEARRAVLEFLLLNHPIDCPVCDQAGECKLQDYYMDYGRYRSRMPLARKVRKGKVVDIGPHVVLDQERCILCTRCTRFLDEVTHTGELGIFERGDHCVIDVFPGGRVENPYSGNIVDVCPVGALTSTDFRFQARVWYLERAESICTACSRGCNVDVYHRRGQIFRFRPRYNPEVNQWWMCDAGRLSYKTLQGDRRLTEPLVRSARGFGPGEWPGALGTAARRLREVAAVKGAGAIVGIASAQATNEELFLLSELVRAGLGGTVHGAAWSPPGAAGDDWLIRADKNPNARGLELFGLSSAAENLTVLDAKAPDAIAGLVLLRADLVRWLGEDRVKGALEAADFILVVDSDMSETAAYADVVLPVGTYVESDGTFTNCDGQLQRVHQAFPPPGEARPGWSALAELAQRVGIECQFDAAKDVFDAMARRVTAFTGLTFDTVGSRGVKVRAATTSTAADVAEPREDAATPTTSP